MRKLLESAQGNLRPDGFDTRSHTSRDGSPSPPHSVRPPIELEFGKGRAELPARPYSLTGYALKALRLVICNGSFKKY